MLTFNWMLGEQGKVEESMREMAAIEALKSEKADKEVSPLSRCAWPVIPHTLSFQRELQQLTDTSGASGHQKLRVCDVCGAYLSVLDSDRRLADHFGGKVCVSWFRLTLTALTAAYRCISDITSYETCLPNLGKNVRKGRWDLL